MTKTARSPTHTVMHHAYREMLGPSMIGMSLITGGVIVVVYTVIGPVGTDTIWPPHRLAYSGVCALLSWPICYSMSVMTVYFARFRSPLGIAPALAVVMLIAAVPCAAIAYTAQALFRSDDSAHAGPMAIYAMAATVAVPCSLLYHYIVCQRVRHARALALAASESGTHDPAQADPAQADPAQADPVREAAAGLDAADRTAVNRAATQRVGPAHGGAGAPPTRFHDRLSRKVDGDLIYLKTEDHYLKTYTTAGACLVLIRFGDAVVELGDQGIQVHRSYWVARGHVNELVTRGSRTLLLLTNDHEVPVSRTYLPAVRAAFPSLRPQTRDSSQSADSAAPDSAAPDSAAPDSAAPDSAAPDSAAPDSAAPARLLTARLLTARLSGDAATPQSVIAPTRSRPPRATSSRMRAA